MSAVIAIVLAIMIAAALWQTIRKFRRGGGCCGDHENVSLRQVSDRNRSHYPYHVILEIGGMTCDNCARKAANDNVK